MTDAGRRGVYPGSFNPLTVAHLAIAEAAVEQCGLATLEMVVSEVALAKEHHLVPPPSERVAVVKRAARSRPWLRGRVTQDRLLADIARGYDLLVLGADKWHQIRDPAFYGGSESARDDAMRRLPPVAVAPRGGFTTPAGAGITVLQVAPELAWASSSAVRAGNRRWRAPEAHTDEPPPP